MIERILTIEKAAERLELDVESLKTMISSNELDALLLPNGGIAINENEINQILKTKNVPDSYIDINTQLLSIKKYHYRHLANIGITFAEAKEKYGVHHTTLRNWQLKNFIRVISYEMPRTLNEQDVAYCTEIYKKRKELGSNFGWPLLDEDGKPNLLKFPGYSLYYKRKRMENE